jgi:hypothetical protein
MNKAAKISDLEASASKISLETITFREPGIILSWHSQICSKILSGPVQLVSQDNSDLKYLEVHARR